MSPSAGIDSERSELLVGFTLESRELLDDVEPLLVGLERHASRGVVENSEDLNRVFRLFHSIKGGAGFLDLKCIGGVTHSAETILDLHRKGKAHIESGHIDILNQSCDFLRQALEEIERYGSDASLGGRSAELVDLLEATISSLTGAPAPSSSPQTELLPPVIDLDSPPPSQDIPESPDGFPVLDITPEMVKAFRLEGDELLEQAEAGLLSLEKEREDADELQRVFRAFHSFKGNAGFLGFGDIERLGHRIESALDAVRSGEASADPQLFDLMLKCIDFLRQALRRLDVEEQPLIPALGGLLSLLDEAENRSRKRREADAGDDSAPVRRKGEPDYQPPFASRADDREEARRVGMTEIPEARAAGESRAQSQSVRVEVSKLDALLDLVGELVIAEAMVTHNPEIKALGVSLDGFDRAAMHLNKITRSMQDVVTAVRMIPLAGTLKRMIRLVRDLSQKAGKQVDLELIGEQTEVDKSVIEQISDPLVHILRNAIDHGIDLPVERERAGKPLIGKLVIEAKYVGGEVWISVIDDGRGLNREKIIARARERGLLDNDGADLSNEAVWQFIFLPGFSTAEIVTDVSGRGVGMDVVKRNIEGIRGKVEVRSQPGTGTTVTMRIPLTLAIIDGMVARVGKSLYTIPTVDIQKSLRPEAKQITVTPDGKKILNMRGSLLPIVDLADHFGSGNGSPLEAKILVVVENERRLVCLGVDELLGQQQIVIKGLSNYVGELTGISGCTILSGGEISLIVDTAGFIKSLDAETV